MTYRVEIVIRELLAQGDGGIFVYFTTVRHGKIIDKEAASQRKAHGHIIFVAKRCVPGGF